MPTVVIGIDSHQVSHTAVAADEHEHPLHQPRVRASAVQAEQLLDWARQWPRHSSANENASGLGYLLAQQLAGAGEDAVDVQPKLVARVRLATAASTKNGPNDARSDAIVALRCTGLPLVSSDDHAAVMKVWVRRGGHVSRVRTKLANQLHTVLCELVPGWIPSLDQRTASSCGPGVAAADDGCRTRPHPAGPRHSRGSAACGQPAARAR